jgi:hypothetical protein
VGRGFVAAVVGWLDSGVSSTAQANKAASYGGPILGAGPFTFPSFLYNKRKFVSAVI